MKKQNIILIGFMGAGKTSVGKAIAEIRKKPLIDTDQMIEEYAGMTISRIFAEKGEKAFRQLETEVLERLLETADGDVISVGGGLPMREENRTLLKKLGMVVYLKVEPETVLERLKGDTTRPLLQAEDVKKRVQSLLAERGPVYTEAAHQTLAVDGRDIMDLAKEIIGMAAEGKGQEMR